MSFLVTAATETKPFKYYESTQENSWKINVYDALWSNKDLDLIGSKSNDTDRSQFHTVLKYIYEMSLFQLDQR